MEGLRSAIGKRVGGFLYLHRSALDLASQEIQKSVADCCELVPDLAWNVIKVSGRQVSLLLYEDFDQVAFPALLASTQIDAALCTVVSHSYEARESPPILHRKELLMRPNDRRVPLFSALTRSAEAQGLFRESNGIGTRRKWNERLKAAGLRVVGHKLVPDQESAVEVARHLTAIARRDLSQPMSLMLRFSMIDRSTSVFDYGCGQGDDVAALRANGFEAFGWDPHHAPDGPRQSADAVNLGFVLNVIEDADERIETLRNAWSFAKRVLTIAVMTNGKGQVGRLVPYKDGFLTSRGTFQRYFSQEELRELVADATGEKPVLLASGVVAVFRDKDLEQEVIYRRRSRAFLISEQFTFPERPPRPIGILVASVRERIEADLEAIWRLALGLGRLPNASELPQEVTESLISARVSQDRAIAICRDTFDSSALRDAAQARRDDLLVHFALTQFPGAPSYSTLPRSIQRDIRAFFGSHSAALQHARRLLFSVGDPETVLLAARDAETKGLGNLVGSRFRFTPSTLSRMPSAIRVVFGCAEVIEDSLGSFDFIEIDPDESNVRAIRCDDNSRALPLIRDVFEIQLKALRVRRSRPRNAVLYLKGSFMPADDPLRPKQLQIDSKMLRAGIVSPEGQGPDSISLSLILAPPTV